MTERRVLGLDYGERRIGVAVSDPVGITAQPHSVIDRTRVEWKATLQQLCDDLGVELIVVGLPVSLSGSDGPASVAVRAFAEEVTDCTGRAVEFVDERFTTVVAEQTLLEAGVKRRKRRDVRDKVAAVLVLQSYLDRRN